MSKKSELFEEYAKIGKALSAGPRLQIIEFLAQCDRCVEEMAQIIDLTIANTSKHLQTLKNCGLIKSTRHGKRVTYSLTDKTLVDTLLNLQALAHRHISDINEIVDSFLTNKDSMPGVSIDSIKDQVKSGDVLLLDVRPNIEYLAGHFPKAINVPLDELKSKLTNLPKNKTIIAYCRGQYCVLSYEAVKHLRQLGYQAYRSTEGIPEWISKGVRLERRQVKN